MTVSQKARVLKNDWPPLWMVKPSHLVEGRRLLKGTMETPMFALPPNPHWLYHEVASSSATPGMKH